MSVLHRLLGSHSKEKDAAGEAQLEVEEVTGDQADNPYTEILILQQHSDIVRLLVPIDERRCLSAGDDNRAVVWDTETGQCLAQLCGHSMPITCVLVVTVEEESEDRPLDFILTGSSDKTIRVWDAETGICRKVLHDVNSSIRCLVSLCEDDFCSGGQDLALWSQQGEGRLLHAFQRGDEEDITHMIVIKTDHLVTAFDKQLVVYSVVPSMSDNPGSKELNMVKKLPQLREVISNLISISDQVFACGCIDGTIVLWTSHNLLPLHKLNVVTAYTGEGNLYPYSVQYLACYEEHYLFAAIGSGFCVFDLAGRERLVVRKLTAHYSRILHLQLVCDGSMLATCSVDGSIRLWGWPASSNADLSEKEELGLGLMERFTGCSSEQLRSLSVSAPLEPKLLGECLAHAGAVQTFLDLGLEGLVSCGGDGLVILWKNTERQKVKRNRIVREQVHVMDNGII